MLRRGGVARSGSIIWCNRRRFSSVGFDGRKYNRAVRLHKLTYDALFRLAWKEFEGSLGDEGQVNLTQLLLSVDDFAENVSGAAWLEVLELQSFTWIVPQTFSSALCAPAPEL